MIFNFIGDKFVYPHIYFYTDNFFFGVFDMGKKIKLKDLVQEGLSIQKKFNKKMNEEPSGNAPGGMMSPDGQYQYANFNELIGDYAQTRYEAELGGTEAHAEAEPQIEPLEKLIIKMKGESYFELVSELVSLQIYAAEYAGPSESNEVKKSIIRISKRLGIPPDATSV